MGDHRAALKLVEAPRPTLEDEEIQRIGRTDPDRGYELAIRKHREPLLRHAVRIVGSWAEGVELVQEVFISALDERRFFEAGFYLRAWLFRVTTNRCLNFVRDRKRRSTLLRWLPRPTERPLDNGLDVLAMAQQQERMLDAIQWMSEDHQAVLLLRYYADLSYAEIAATTGLPLGTVMSRINRGRRAMLDVISDCGVDLSEG